MASVKGRRQLVGFWWVLAFMLGAAAGALSSNLVGMPYTAWWIVGFCGSAALVVGLVEWFGQGRQPGPAPHYDPLAATAAGQIEPAAAEDLARKGIRASRATPCDQRAQNGGSALLKQPF